MTIHLISDQASAAMCNFLVDYVGKFLTAKIKIKASEQQLIHQDFWTWDELFDLGKELKYSDKKPCSQDFYVSLVDGQNEHNWFAAFDPEEPSVGFLQTSGWEDFDLKQPKFAVAYHLVTLVTAMKFFGNDPEPYSFYHDQSVGCMFDFTGYKEEVIYKLKSAHICPDCIQSIAKKSAGNPQAFTFMKSVKELLESVRDNLFRVEWGVFFQHYTYTLVVKEDLALELQINGEQIALPISKGRESAMFIMLLKHENGLSYDDFEKPQFKREYLSIYHRYFVRNDSLETLIKQADVEIQHKTYKGNLQSLISKIKSKLTSTLKQYPEIQKQLLIKKVAKRAMIVPINRQMLDGSRVPELKKKAG
jgi:hypothetical protein